MEIRKPQKQQRMIDLYDRAEDIRPLAEKDGQIWVDFESASIINSINAMDPKIGTQLKNTDGTLASTGKTVHAINPDYFFSNRVKIKGTGKNKKMYVVSGHTADAYRAIKEQQSGHCHLAHIPAYCIGRDEEGKLTCESLISVPAAEFIADYTQRLDNSLMAQILPLIAKYEAKQDIVADMPI